jgi:hypothetical protein
LRNLGSQLENWLREHPEFAGRNLALALDMIRLEWAHIETFDSGERKPLGPEDLLELGPELVIALQPHIRLLEFQYPVDELRIQIGRQLEEHGQASNAVAAPTGRRVVGRHARPKRQQIFLAVHRVEFTVYYRRLDPEEFALLLAFGHGRSIGAALQDSQVEPAEIQTWFGNWAQLGWLCQGDR